MLRQRAGSLKGYGNSKEMMLMEPRTREGIWEEVTTAQQTRGLSTDVWPESSPWKGRFPRDRML